MTTHPPELVLCELADPGIPGVESFSPFCLKVHRALRFAGLRYVRRHASRPDAFRKYNPVGQVPVLLVGDEPVFDSTRILARIDALSFGALSADASVSAEARLWEEMADTALNGFVVAARWADPRNWPRTRTAYFGGAPWPVRTLIAPRIRAGVIGRLRARDVWLHGQDACWERFNLVLEDLEARAPKAGWWLGRALSAADLSIFAQLHSLRTPLTEPQRDAVAARPRLSSWLDRVNDATLENLGERTQDDTRPAQSPQSPTLPPTQVRSLL